MNKPASLLRSSLINEALESTATAFETSTIIFTVTNEERRFFEDGALMHMGISLAARHP